MLRQTKYPFIAPNGVQRPSNPSWSSISASQNRGFLGFEGKEYRYTFNGQEQDAELAGPGNFTTAEFWEYDSRLGRRWNLDPVLKEWEGPYSCLAGNPILMNDPNGDDPITAGGIFIVTQEASALVASTGVGLPLAALIELVGTGIALWQYLDDVEVPTSATVKPPATIKAPTATPKASTAAHKASTATPKASTAAHKAPTATSKAPTTTPKAPTKPSNVKKQTTTLSKKRTERPYDDLPKTMEELKAMRKRINTESKGKPNKEQKELLEKIKSQEKLIKARNAQKRNSD